tara:strand:- start:668 stop:979 length:312 start_codon:yes stop_codon:yes gene_type:complete
MPARFVEVTNPLEAARKSGSLSYVTGLGWDKNPLHNLNFTFYNTSTGNATLENIQRVFQRASLPSGLSRALLFFAVFVYVLEKWFVHYQTRRALARFGRSHQD